MRTEGGDRTKEGVWASVPLGSVSQVVDCKHVTAKFASTGYPVVSIGELGNRYVSLGSAPRTTAHFYRILTDGARRLRPGDLIMSRNATVGRVARVNEKHPSFAMGQDVVLIRPRSSEILPNYLQQLIKSPSIEQQFADMMAGSTFKRVNVQDIKRLALSLPDVSEQARVADALDTAEDLVMALEHTIAKKHAIKQGMMQQLLTGRTRLPGFDGELRNVRLGDHVTYVKTVALSRAQLDQTSPLRYLHYGDIHTRSAVTLDASVEAMPRADSRLAGRAGLLRRGDLVFADASEDPAGVGKSVEITGVPDDGVVPGLHTIAARFNKSVLADGFKAYLQFIPAFRDTLLRLAAGTKVLATTRSYISSITLSLPDVDEQQAIAGVLQDCEAELEALQDRLAKARAIKTGMMQQLLTGRVRLPVEAAS